MDNKQHTTSTEEDRDEAANVKYLKPGDFTLFQSDGGGLRLTLKDSKSVLRVKAKRCFPFTFSNRYISIRDGDDEEIGIISDLGSLSKEYRRWIEDDLDIRYFTPRVTAIKSIRYRFGGIEWHVVTDCGPKRLITKGVHDTMMEVEPGRYVINDVDANRYEVFADDLDEASRGRLSRLI